MNFVGLYVRLIMTHFVAGVFKNSVYLIYLAVSKIFPIYSLRLAYIDNFYTVYSTADYKHR